MTRSPFILSTLTRLAQPHRPNRLLLSTPIRRTNRGIPLPQGANTSGMDPPSAGTAAFVRDRQGPIADSVPTANALSP